MSSPARSVGLDAMLMLARLLMRELRHVCSAYEVTGPNSGHSGADRLTGPTGGWGTAQEPGAEGGGPTLPAFDYCV
jgi:hypothetical protein